MESNMFFSWLKYRVSWGKTCRWTSIEACPLAGKEPAWWCKLQVTKLNHVRPTRNTSSTPWKINMEPETDGLEDDFPFQLGDLFGSMLIFRGVVHVCRYNLLFWSALQNQACGWFLMPFENPCLQSHHPLQCHLIWSCFEKTKTAQSGNLASNFNGSIDSIPRLR